MADSSISIRMLRLPDVMEEAAKSLYGTVFRAYVAELVQRLHTEPEALKGRLKALQGEFEAQLPPDLASQPVPRGVSCS